MLQCFVSVDSFYLESGRMVDMEPSDSPPGTFYFWLLHLFHALQGNCLSGKRANYWKFGVD